MLEQRSEQQEIMDDLNISGDVIGQTLKELDVINRRLGGNAISLAAFRRFLKTHQIHTLADLGCGGADILIEMARMANQMQAEVSFTGVDANENIVTYARQHTSNHKNIHIRCENIFSEQFRQNQYDIIHCCLFTHHFTSEELVFLFKSFIQQARVGIIINDLHRHWLAYHSIKLITRFFSRSYMVRNDAAISVARGFKKRELQDILEKAGISNYKLNWRWAFRWQLIITHGE